MNSDTLIAVVEDDPVIRRLVCDLLIKEGFETAACSNAGDLDRTLERRRVDLVILDVMMPGEDGLSVCRRLRATNQAPVLMVTAKADDIDRIIGLEIGADDYLPKPFNSRELVARARAILRRTRDVNAVAQPILRSVMRFEGWTLETANRALSDPAGAPVVLTTGEYDLLLCFLQHPQRILNRDQLLDWTRGRSATPYDRAIDVQVGRLRRKLADEEATLIRTVRGGGYLFAAAVEREG